MTEVFRPRYRYVIEGTFTERPYPLDSTWKFLARSRTLWGAKIVANRLADGYRHVRVRDSWAGF